MKSKNIGVYGLALLGLATATIAVDALWAGWSGPDIRPVRYDYAYGTERLLIDRVAVSRMDVVQPAMPKLVRPASVVSQGEVSQAAGIDYSMFGPPREAPVAQAIEKVKEKEKQYSAPEIYRVSMTYISGVHRYAVIDKKLYSINARLPRGESLLEIEAGAILIELGGKRRWIPIETAVRQK